MVWCWREHTECLSVVVVDRFYKLFGLGKPYDAYTRRRIKRSKKSKALGR